MIILGQILFNHKVYKVYIFFNIFQYNLFLVHKVIKVQVMIVIGVILHQHKKNKEIKLLYNNMEYIISRQNNRKNHFNIEMIRILLMILLILKKLANLDLLRIRIQYRIVLKFKKKKFRNIQKIIHKLRNGQFLILCLQGQQAQVKQHTCNVS